MTSLGFVLTLVFVFLKAFDVAALTWLQVFLPLLIAIGLDVALFLVMALFGGATARRVAPRDRFRR